MIIEFYGPPASGKTTVAAFMAEKYNFQNIKIRKKTELVWYNFMFFVRYPIKSVWIFFYLLRDITSFNIFYFKLMNTFFDYNAKYMKARKYKKAILDQGHFQNVIALFEKSLTLEELTKYIKILPKPDKLFVFSTSLEIRAERVTGRGYFARQKFDKEYILKWQEAIEKNHKLFCNNIKSIFPKTWIINGQDDTKKSSENIFYITTSE